MQGGVTASQTQSFVESVSAQFEKLFKNLDQIGETNTKVIHCVWSDCLILTAFLKIV